MIFRVAAADPNRNVIVETITDFGRRTIMAQRYVPEIVDGDKRVLVIGGKPGDPPNRFYTYGVVARLAALAAAIEVEELVASANAPQARAANE
jgi:glutathione synthase/RimK-type ligase-like ATP-grasp enzyme